MRVEWGDVPEGAVWAGVDTHAGTNWLSVVDRLGTELFSGEFPTGAAGYRALIARAREAGRLVAAGVECTATYGAGLAREMASEGVACYEVVVPTRGRRRRGSGKDDAGDALRAARQALSGDDLAVPKSQDGWVEEVRALYTAREGLVRSCTSLANIALATVRRAPDALRARLEPLGATGIMRACAGWEGMGAAGDPVELATMASLAALGAAWVSQRKSARELERGIAEALRRGNPALAAMYGCGPLSAAALALAAGDNPERLGSEASFAALCGACPIEASSGKVRRHRLNRGGDRRANRALHVIAVHRMRTDPRTIAYVERRRAEGLSDREVRRCLKRYIAREAYRLLMHPYDVPAEGTGPALREERLSAGVTQRDAAAALGVTASTLCDMELGHHQFRELALRYRRWVDEGFPMDVAISS
jgi:transposase